MTATIREKLQNLAEEEYRIFVSGLLPKTSNILGVRLPLIRKLAGEIAKGGWREYLGAADNEINSEADRGVDHGAGNRADRADRRVESGAKSVYLEEIMLRGMILGCVKCDVEEILRYVADFVPKIDNWSVCDSFCAGLKFTKRYKERVWDFLQPFFSSNGEYELRFGIVMLLDFYIEEAYIDRVLLLLDNVKHDGYYVKMAVAWAVSVCFVKLPEPTMKYLRNNTLDNFTYNKALQKISESYRVDRDTKDLIRSMKRK